MYIIVERKTQMNIMTPIENEILENALVRFSEIFGSPLASADEPLNIFFDALVTIKGVKFQCIINGDVTNSNFNSVACQLITRQQKCDNLPILLVVRRIYPKYVKELADLGYNCLDSFGNCYIKYDNLFISIKGEKASISEKRPRVRLFQEAGLKLIFHFLCHPNSINLPLRAIQEEVGISLGSTQYLVEELINANYILKTDKGRYLKNTKELIERWVTGYNEMLKPKLFMKRMEFRSAEKRDNWKTISLPTFSQWGGEPAANIYDNYLIPGEFTIYLEGNANQLFKTGYIIPDEDGSIKIYKKFWTCRQEGNSIIIPPLLIYADLVGSGNSRNIEAAQRIYENELSNFGR